MNNCRQTRVSTQSFLYGKVEKEVFMENLNEKYACVMCCKNKYYPFTEAIETQHGVLEPIFSNGVCETIRIWYNFESEQDSIFSTIPNMVLSEALEKITKIHTYRLEIGVEKEVELNIDFVHSELGRFSIRENGATIIMKSEEEFELHFFSAESDHHFLCKAIRESKERLETCPNAGMYDIYDLNKRKKSTRGKIGIDVDGISITICVN